MIKLLRSLLLLSILFFTPFTSYTSPAHHAAPMPHAEMPMGQGGLIPQPTEEEMRYIMEEFLPNLSDEELEELAKIGQEIIDTAEKEGIPLWQPPVSNPTKTAPPTDNKVPTKDVQKEKPTTKKAAPSAAKKRIKDLITVIDDIRQKASSDQELEDDFAPLDNEINSLLYYLHVLNDEKLITYLIEKEFESLNDNLKNLRYDLEVLNNTFIVPSQKVYQTKKEEAAHKDAIKKAEAVLKQIMIRFRKAFKQEAIIVDIEKLLKKYEPEALKTKKESDAAEKKAEQFLKTLPKTNTSGHGGFAGSHGFPPLGNRGPIGAKGAQPFNRVNPGSKTSRAQEKPTNTIKKNDTTKKVNPKKKPDPKSTSSGFESNIISKLNEFEKFINPYALRLNDFSDHYKSNKTEDSSLKPILQEATFKAKRLKKEVELWFSAVEKEAKSYSESKAKKKKLKDLWNNKLAHQKLKQLHSKMSDLEDKKVSMQGDFKGMYVNLKKVVETILDI
jgi:hypothetical protein